MLMITGTAGLILQLVQPLSCVLGAQWVPDTVWGGVHSQRGGAVAQTPVRVTKGRNGVGKRIKQGQALTGGDTEPGPVRVWLKHARACGHMFPRTYVCACVTVPEGRQMTRSKPKETWTCGCAWYMYTFMNKQYASHVQTYKCV